MRTRSDLRPGQRIISNIVQTEKAKLIILGMGGGKTGATLDGLTQLLNRLEIDHVLIIAPRFVAYNTWSDEIAAWAHTQALSCAIAIGTAEERAAAIDRRAEITTINFDNLGWLAKHIRTVENWYWDTVIVDESSRLKAGEARTKATKVRRADGSVRVSKGGNMTRFGIVTTARRKIDRMFLLTGTPAPQGVIDLWAQCYLLDQGKALGRSKSEFERTYFDRNRYSHEVKIKPGAEAKILKKIEHLVVTIPQEKVVPDPQFIPMKVDLPAKALAEYKEFEATLYSEPYDVEAVSSGVLANKLLQFANGSMYREDRTVAEIHEAKIEALEELVDTANGENLLIFYGFKFDKDKIKERYPDAVVANEYKGDLVGDWNKGKINKMLAHPASIGHGVNLQYGGHIAAWYGLTFSLELWLQANMRLPRPGQTKQVLIYPIIARNTYDERALNVLNQKDVTQEHIIQNFALKP